MEYAIRSQGLSRRFGKMAAVQGLNLEIPAGTVSAFLGPNGAGKTTTIRLLLGLLKADAGTCEVLGHAPGDFRALAQLGAMVESPSLYAHLTGFENVEITRLMRGASRSESDRVLAMVGLIRDAKRAVREYSLGMRQRLGLALALIGDPRLLILDEPTNGLDPAGIQEMRELIRGFPRQTGATVFLSSHLLAEVEQVSQHLVVIHHGSIKYQGALECLGANAPSHLLVRVNDPRQALQCLSVKGFTAQLDGDQIRVQAVESEAALVADCLFKAGLALHELTPLHESLESRFLALVEGT